MLGLGPYLSAGSVVGCLVQRLNDCNVSSVHVKGTSLASLRPLRLEPQTLAAPAVWTGDFSHHPYG